MTTALLEFPRCQLWLAAQATLAVRPFYERSAYLYSLRSVQADLAIHGSITYWCLGRGGERLAVIVGVLTFSFRSRLFLAANWAARACAGTALAPGHLVPLSHQKAIAGYFLVLTPERLQVVRVG